MIAEKTAKNFRGLLYFAAPCTFCTATISAAMFKTPVTVRRTSV